MTRVQAQRDEVGRQQHRDEAIDESTQPATDKQKAGFASKGSR